MRSKADYNVMYLPEREEAEEALELAENFLERARGLMVEWKRKGE